MEESLDFEEKTTIPMEEKGNGCEIKAWRFHRGKWMVLAMEHSQHKDQQK